MLRASRVFLHLVRASFVFNRSPRLLSMLNAVYRRGGLPYPLAQEPPPIGWTSHRAPGCRRLDRQVRCVQPPSSRAICFHDQCDAVESMCAPNESRPGVQAPTQNESGRTMHSAAPPLIPFPCIPQRVQPGHPRWGRCVHEQWHRPGEGARGVPRSARRDHVFAQRFLPVRPCALRWYSGVPGMRYLSWVSYGGDNGWPTHSLFSFLTAGL